RFVNVIGRGDVGPMIWKVFGNDDDLRANIELSKARLDERPPALAGSQDAIFGDLGSNFVIADENGERGDIALAAVRVAGADDESLDGIRALENRSLRENFDAAD